MKKTVEIKTHLPRTRPVPLDDAWDVIVIGGGPAGCAAATAAARDGARTLLVESTGSLGGMGTNGMVPAWTPFSDREKIIYGGIATRVFTACKAGMPHVPSDATDWVPIDPELLRRIYDELVTAAGAQTRFNTHLSAVERDGDRISTILVTNKAGLSALQAHVYVDCTGDADLCAWAGAGFHKGDATGGRLMPATHCFALANVDMDAYRASPPLHPSNPRSPVYEIVRSGKYPLIPDTHLCASVVGPGVIGFNAGHLWDVDNTDPASVSRALVRGRAMAAQFRDALAEYCPAAFGRAFLVSTAPLLGIRETRRVTGDYSLTIEDYLARRSFPDEIARNSYFLDVHWAKDALPLDHDQLKSWDASCLHYGPGESHGIPFRCLTPAGLENALVAGRSISCDQAVQSSIRVMPACLITGEAAGAAAADAALRHAGKVRTVDIGRLRIRLAGAGAHLPPVPEALAEQSRGAPCHAGRLASRRGLARSGGPESAWNGSQPAQEPTGTRR